MGKALVLPLTKPPQNSLVLLANCQDYCQKANLVAL